MADRPLRITAAFLSLIAVGCGSTPPEATTPAAAADGGALACAGQDQTDSRVIPEVGRSMDGDPITAGVALACEADHLVASIWSPDSSSVWEIGRAEAMEVWNTFEAATSLDERTMLLLNHR